MAAGACTWASRPCAVDPRWASCHGYLFPWSVRGWLSGDTAQVGDLGDPVRFAVSVGEFLVALQACDPAGGPAAGEHSFHRGTSPAHYDSEVRSCLAKLEGRIDTARAAAVWEAALEADWTGEPVWFTETWLPGTFWWKAEP